MRRLRRLAVGLLLALSALAAGAQERSQGELRTRTALRVCADPDNLPFSNRKGEGFENRIAELFARELGLPLVYAWHPQTIGFVRNTLRAHRCDVVMGITAGHELVSNTRSYYRSTYVLVYRAADRGKFDSLDSPLARIARIGVVANTPPALLLTWKGLVDNVRSYELQVDTRISHPARQAVLDVAAGRLDMALVWGPIGAYWAARSEVPLEWVPLRGDPRRKLPTVFRISMGVRYGEKEWLDTLNRLIRKKRREIRAILEEYGVPLVRPDGRLLNPPPWLAEKEQERRRGRTPRPGPQRPAPGKRSAVPEPQGYRTADYHAPVPATLAGATVLDLEGLLALMERERPVLVDVHAGARRPPPGRGGGLWLAPERESIPGAAWLPNVGVGEPPDDLRAYFAGSLEALTGGRKDRPLVFFCARDCWLSWNAAKRARHELGYLRVYWYPDGIDGWREAGRPLARVRPFEPAGADRDETEREETG